MPPYTPGKAILSALNLVRGYGAQPVLDGVSLTIHEGDRIGLIGRNGSGKSTLLRLLAGVDKPDGGEVTRMAGLDIALLAQTCPAPREWTVAQFIEDATRGRRALLDDYQAALHALADGPPDGPEHERLQEQSTELQHRIEAHGAWDLDLEVKRISVALRLPDPARTLGSLSGGELRRTDMAGRLLERPDVLLLDEPTNHIDTRSVEWIESFLETYPGSCVLVTHDRYFLDRVVNRIVEVEFNRLLSFPGNYERFLEYKASIEETAVRTEDNRLALIRRELAWIRRGAKARTTKQKARINRFDDVEAQGPPAKHREFEFVIPDARPLSKTILEARKLCFGYEGRDIIHDFSFIVQAGMRIGVLGPNGSGKTTLLRLLMGKQEPRKGKLIIGDNTDFLYVDQAHEDVKPQQTVLEFVSGGSKHLEVGKRRIYIPAYLEKFLFDKHAVNVPMSTLSGGETNRLDLVRKLLRGGNFLVLDEPTNDLDLYTLRILEELIDGFDGCALIVSHDRYFLNRVCTHMLVFEEDGHVEAVVGDYDDYLRYVQGKKESDREAARETARSVPKPPAAASADAARPTKLTYKERLELEGMEAAIEHAEAEIVRLETAINAEDFYRQDNARVQETLRALDAARNDAHALFARWEDLEARNA